MTTRKWSPPKWSHTASGLAVPGPSSSISMSSSLTYVQIKEKALAVKALYADSMVQLPPTSGLESLIANAIDTSDIWQTGRADSISHTMLFNLVQLDRVAEALLPLRAVDNRAKYLGELASGCLSPFNRARSKAKDTLWELELWATLKRRSFAADLEEPDIVVEVNGATIGIACKKFYSTKHVQHVLSKGVAQIESAYDFGIIGVSLDDLPPPDTIFKAPTRDAIGEVLTQANFEFLRDHERHFRKYLSSGRLLGALVSTGGIAEVYQEDPRLNTARQSTMWVIPGLTDEKMQMIH